jgi:hypothetical protein
MGQAAIEAPCIFDWIAKQTLDRTQPGLPLKKSPACTMNHTYTRNGATTLFAALDVTTGKPHRRMLAATGVPVENQIRTY